MTALQHGPLHGKTALVTGASGGAGLLAARALAQTEPGLYLSGVNFLTLDTAARAIKKDFPVSIEIHTGNPANSTDAEAMARFTDEARVVVQLSHRNICPVFDVGRVGGGARGAGVARVARVFFFRDDGRRRRPRCGGGGRARRGGGGGGGGCC